MRIEGSVFKPIYRPRRFNLVVASLIVFMLKAFVKDTSQWVLLLVLLVVGAIEFTIYTLKAISGDSTIYVKNHRLHGRRPYMFLRDYFRGRAIAIPLAGIDFERSGFKRGFLFTDKLNIYSKTGECIRMSSDNFKLSDMRELWGLLNIYRRKRERGDGRLLDVKVTRLKDNHDEKRSSDFDFIFKDYDKVDASDFKVDPLMSTERKS